MVKIAFDVDGTLRDYNNVPRQEILALVRVLAASGILVYVWSGGGLKYAQQVIRDLDLVGVVIATTKGVIVPDFAFDDQDDCGLGKHNIFVPPKLLG